MCGCGRKKCFGKISIETEKILFQIINRKRGGPLHIYSDKVVQYGR